MYISRPALVRHNQRSKLLPSHNFTPIRRHAASLCYCHRVHHPIACHLNQPFMRRLRGPYSILGPVSASYDCFLKTYCKVKYYKLRSLPRFLCSLNHPLTCEAVWQYQHGTCWKASER